MPDRSPAAPPEAPDAELLERFRAARAEAPFHALAVRHGPMVFRACLRLLGDFHAAEDATQAVFLVLAKRPPRGGSLPAWLHGVARRTCLGLLRSRRRRLHHEEEARRMKPMPSPDERSLQAELDQALDRLPVALKEAVLLRYLEGRSQEDAARLAGCPQGTLAWRAAQGLSRLRDALAGRGVVLGGTALAALLASEASAAVPASLLAGLQLSALPASGAAVAAAQGAAQTLVLAKAKFAAIGVAAALASAVAVAALAGAPPQEPPRPAAPTASAEAGAAYNITLVTDNAPDFTDVESYLRSITSQHPTPREKAIALWRWSQKLRKQAGHPREEGHEVIDPIQMFTSYGYSMCGLISATNNALWLKLGWKARYVQLGDHTVSECSWDGGKTWHMFDSSMAFFCFNDQGEIASTKEIEENPRYYLRNFPPEIATNPVQDVNDHQGWRVGTERPVEFRRTLAAGWESFAAPNQIIEDHLVATWGRTYAITLRPGDEYVRHFDNLDAPPNPRYYRPNGGRDPEGAFFKNIRANGVWRSSPDLRDPKTRPHVYAESGVSWTPDGLRGPGWVIFKVSAANVVTSASVALRGNGATVSVSRDAGLRWTRVDGDLFEAVAGSHEFLVKVELDGPQALLSGIDIETITQINRPSLPTLTRGANRVQARLGKQVESIVLTPSLLEGRHRQTVHAEQNVELTPKPYYNVATLRAKEEGTSHVTWKVSAPTPVVGVTYGGNVTVKAAGTRASFLHSWDGTSFSEDFRKADGAHPWDLMALAAVDRVPAETRDVYLRYAFERTSTTSDWQAPGLQTALIRVEHRPRVSAFAPYEITYCWVEHRPEGDVERRHAELVSSPAHEYTIHVAGFRDPTMKWVRLNLKREKTVYGYSDGKDVGPGAERPRERYTWGRNLAQGRPYTLDGRPSAKNPDGKQDLTDGIVAPPETYVSVKWMPTNVIFDAGVTPRVTIDLGAETSVAAVRVHAGQEPDFRLTFPDAIEVETSVDGRVYAPAGRAEFNQVFDPPADFVPWECDDSAIYDALPAGGRLAYGYRILFEKAVSARYVRVSCRPRSGWGSLLSEVQVYDTVSVDRQPPPAVVLPPLPR